MKRILLSQGMFALVDDEDFDFIAGYGIWFAHKSRTNFYAECKKDGKVVKMHHLVLKPGAGFMIDHENGNGLDNTRNNLRIVTHLENMQNKKVYSNNKSGTPGVYYAITSKGKKYWHAQITRNGKQRLIGRFLTQEEAIKARLHAQENQDDLYAN